jgi:hypothetical protein
MANILTKVKNAKLWYYVKNIVRQGIPVMFYQQALKRRLRSLENYSPVAIADRVNYYNKLDEATSVGSKSISLGNMPIFKSPKAYNFDTFEYTRYFDKSLKANFLFGDVTHVADVPSIQKSRPVFGDNKNAILLKLDTKRHFIFIKDNILFAHKKNKLIGRGIMSQAHRIRFMEQYFDSPLCDLGDVNKRAGNTAWVKPKLSIEEHLQYKFILSLEGNDVATNLKWIMATNSIAVMPKPKYETWFMEGRLIPNYHYIEIKEDYTDLEEKLNYYIANPAASEAIIANANQYVKQFLDKQQEDLIALLVLQKYFKCTSQI